MNFKKTGKLLIVLGATAALALSIAKDKRSEKEKSQ
jgi:hypothetical protein